MSHRVVFAAALAALAAGCNLFTDAGRDPLEVAALSLASPTYPVLALQTWPRTATVRFTLVNAAGTSLCGRVPVTVEVTDSGVAFPTNSPTGADPCTLALQVHWIGSTWLRVRAGARADSLELRVTPTEFQAELRAPAAKRAGSVVEWEVTIRTGDGRVVPGVRVGFAYHVPYSDHRSVDPYPFEWAAVVTDGDGVARYRRTLPTSTQYGFERFTPSMGSTRSFGAGGAMRVDWSPPVGVGWYHAWDAQPIVPGAAETLAVRVLRCAWSRGSDRSCLYHVPSLPVRLVSRTCPDGSGMGDALVGVAYDAWKNPVETAPAVEAEPGLLAPVEVDRYGESWTTGSFHHQSWHQPSQAAYASLAEGVDSARVTISHPGLPSQTVDVVRDTTPCP